MDIWLYMGLWLPICPHRFATVTDARENNFPGEFTTGTGLAELAELLIGTRIPTISSIIVPFRIFNFKHSIESLVFWLFSVSHGGSTQN